MRSLHRASRAACCCCRAMAASRARCSASAIRWIRSPMRTRPSRCRRAIGRWRPNSMKTRVRALHLGWGLGAYKFTRYKAPLRAPARLVAGSIDAETLDVMAACVQRARPGQHARRRHGPGPTRTGVLRTRRSARRADRSGQRRRPARPELSGDLRRRPRVASRAALDHRALGRCRCAEARRSSARACASTPAASTSRPPTACAT